MIAAPHTALYAALLALLFVALSVRVIAQRRRGRVAIGVAGHPALERVARVQANFAEYVPLALLLILMVEVSGYPAAIVHIAGMLLLAGRMVHAWGVSQAKEDFRLRVVGMVVTLNTILVLALLLIAGFVLRLV